MSRVHRSRLRGTDEHGNVHVKSRRSQEEAARSQVYFPAGTPVRCQYQTTSGLETLEGVVERSEYSRAHRMTVVSVRTPDGLLRRMDAAHFSQIGGA